MSVVDRVFAAVFPPASDIDVPTPAATPVLPSSSFGEAFSSYATPQPITETSASEQIKWDRAWHTATAYLALPDEPILVEDGEESVRRKFVKPYGRETQKAVEYVLSDNSKGRRLRKGQDSDDLLRWYYEVAVLDHYCTHMLQSVTEVGRVGPPRLQSQCADINLEAYTGFKPKLSAHCGQRDESGSTDIPISPGAACP